MELVRDTKYSIFDIETALNNNNNLIPVLCKWKTKDIYKYYIIINYDSVKSMFKNCFNDHLFFLLYHHLV